MTESARDLENISIYFQKLMSTLKDESEHILNPIIENGLQWLERAQNADGGFGLKGKGQGTTGEVNSIVQLTAFALLALSKAGKQLSSKTVQSTLEYLKGTQNRNGSWPCESGNQLESVGVTGMIVQALNYLKMDKADNMFNRALQFLMTSLSKEKGCWRENTYSEEFGEISVNESATSAVKEFLSEEEKRKLADLLLSKRNVDLGYGWRLGDSRSDVENTAFALKILANTDLDKAHVKIKEIIEYIINAQRDGGGFPIKKGGIAENDATAIAISGLMAIGVEPFDKVIRSGIKFLLDSRNKDGGWGDKPGMDSDTDSTALAIMALVDGGIGGVPFANMKARLADTHKFIQSFIEDHDRKIESELIALKTDLKGSERLNHILEVVITFLAIILSIMVTFVFI